MAAIKLQRIPSFYAKTSVKSFFISSKTYGKCIVCKNYCIAYQDNKTCFLPADKYHNKLLGEFEELVQKLQTFFFTYGNVDCLYTLFKYRFSGKLITKSRNMFDNVQRAISFNQRNRGVNILASIAKKKLLRKKFKQHFMTAYSKNKSMQTSGPMFAERIEKATKT